MNIRQSCLICPVISSTALLPGTLMAEEGWAILKGRFVYDGAPPAAKYLETSGKDSEICGKHKIPDESLLVDSASKGIANALVFARKTSRAHESHQQAVKDEVVFDQKDCVFLSHVLPVRVGQTVVIKNSDPIGHNTKITTQADVDIDWAKGRFKLKLKAGETKDLGTIAVSARAFK